MQRPYPYEVNIFVHLIDVNGDISSQQDYLGAPSWQWESGDRFLHLHKLSLPVEDKASIHSIRIGIYQPENDARLPVKNLDIDLDHITILLESRDS